MYRMARLKWSNKAFSSMEEIARVELLVMKRSSPASTAVSMSPLISQMSPQLSSAQHEASDDYPYGFPSSEKRQVTITRIPPSIAAVGSEALLGPHFSPNGSSVESTPPPPPPDTPSTSTAEDMELTPPPPPPSEPESPPPPLMESPEYRRSDSVSRYCDSPLLGLPRLRFSAPAPSFRRPLLLRRSDPFLPLVPRHRHSKSLMLGTTRSVFGQRANPPLTQLSRHLRCVEGVYSRRW